MKSPAHSVTVLLCLYHDLGLWLSNFSLSTVCTSVSTSFCISNRCSQLQILVWQQVEVTQHNSTLVVTLSNERRILVNNFTEGWGLGKLLECWLFESIPNSYRIKKEILLFLNQPTYDIRDGKLQQASLLIKNRKVAHINIHSIEPSLISLQIAYPLTNL